MKSYYELMTEMSKTDERELESRISVLIEHMLKREYVKGQVAALNARGWKVTIRTQQADLAAHIKLNPGLKSLLSNELLDTLYKSVYKRLRVEFPGTAFPSSRQIPLDKIVGSENQGAPQ